MADAVAGLVADCGGAKRVMRRRVQAGLLFSGIAIGCYQFSHWVEGFGHGFEMAAVARNLAMHGVYGNPFDPAVTGPTALVPPLYPLFLAGLIKAFGSLVWMALLADGANIVVNALIAALMLPLAEEFFGDWKPGAFAGALWLWAMRLMPQWDLNSTIVLEATFCLVTARTIGRKGGVAWRGAAAGILGGMLSLLNPATLIVFAAWAAYLLLRRRVGWRYAMRYGAAMLFAVAACNAPWVARNYGIWHRFVLKSNFGIVLYTSNNDCAEPSFVREMANGCLPATNPADSAAEVRLLNRLGEVEYDRNRAATAWSWIRAHPGRFCYLTLARIFEFWFPEPIVPPYTIYGFWAITLLSIPGIVLMARLRMPVVLFVLAVWMVYPLMYYLAVTSDRYRYPILWTSMLPAGYCLTALAERWRKMRVISRRQTSAI
jgi:hypothetical protein